MHKPAVGFVTTYCELQLGYFECIAKTNNNIFEKIFGYCNELSIYLFKLQKSPYEKKPQQL